MHYKKALYFCLSVLLLVKPLSADIKDTADYISSDPANFLNQDINLNVVCVKPLNCASPVPNVVWFVAKTAGTCKPRNRTPSCMYNYSDNTGASGTIVPVDLKVWFAPDGGSIAVAVDASNAGMFCNTYGLKINERNDGYVIMKTLNGTFRAGGPNSGYFVDCTTKGQFKVSGFISDEF